ncbi:MAG: DUF4198 domain-containing protein [Methanomassiliicoccus sp.]|nr:DUF4198 domain-containing protein [Methanomassiliicoccus sp.]
MDKRLLEKLSKVYYGHELWLDTSSNRGINISCHLRYGHNMSVDGIAPKDYVNPFVYTPNKSLREMAIGVEEKNGWKISCPRTVDGDYTFYTDSSSVWCRDSKGDWKMGAKAKVGDVAYSGAYKLVAKRIISVKADGRFAPKAHTTLDILPPAREVKLGDTALFTVKYEKKNLLAGQMKAYCKDSGKESMVDVMKGKAAVTIDSKGTWMFLVRHRDETKKVSDEFDETVYVTTLTMEIR